MLELFNWLDVVVLGFVALGAWRGFRTGAILELGRIAGTIVAFVLAVQLMDTAGLFVTGYLGFSEFAAAPLGFLIVFLGVLLAVTLTSYLIQFIVGRVKLGGVNRLAGSGIGVLKSVLLVSIAFLLFDAVKWPPSVTRDDSLFYHPVADIAPATWKALSRALPDKGIALPLRLRPAREDE